MLNNLRVNDVCFLSRFLRSIPPSLHHRLLAVTTFALLNKHPVTTASLWLILLQVYLPILLDSLVVSTSMMAATRRASSLLFYDHDTLVLLCLLHAARVVLILNALILLTIVVLVLVVIVVMQVI
jgi:hypothetical protein